MRCSAARHFEGLQCFSRNCYATSHLPARPLAPHCALFYTTVHKLPCWMPEVQVNEALGRAQAWQIWETKAKRKKNQDPHR